MSVEKLALAKIEATYGVDPTPDDTNAIETMDLEMLRYEGDTQTRDVDRQSLGGKAQINTNPHTSTSFKVPFAGSGTLGTAPAHGDIWRACGFDETIVAATSVAYQLPELQGDLSAADSVSIWDYRSQAGMAQKSTGVRGKNMINMERGGLPYIEFSNMMGSYNQPITLATPTGIDWTAWRTELPFTSANVPVLTLDSVSACVQSFSIDFGQTVGRRNLPNCDQTIISGYETVGSMTIVAPTLATKNWFATQESHNGVTLVPLALTYGTAAGDVITIAAASVQVMNISEGESDEGDLTLDFDLSFIDRPIVTFV
jgi:hypothetical protein